MRIFVSFLTLLVLCIGCNNNPEKAVQSHPYTNNLIHESSPYLLQHAHNPVHWNPWSETAFERAKTEKKLIVVSIGYAACHWCHVMERESFEDSTVAAIMNTHYISVKVDREERPDVDQTYINAVQLMTGNAGWPLNVITLPDGKPVFGGTYFKKEEWLQALNQIQQLYNTDPEKLVEYANHLEEGIKSIDLIELNTETLDFSSVDMRAALDLWKNSFDTINGGRSGAPKFMMPNQLDFFLKRGALDDDQKLLDHVSLTLKKMAYGGLYDHIGGGFARYSTDDRWHVPHFEKMLYDNAQLVSLYSKAYQANPSELYKKVVTETLDYIRREMTHSSGGFYSSLDADSESETGMLEEGAFYIYSEEELKEAITEKWDVFKAYFNVNEFGFWEEEKKYVLIRTESESSIATQFNLTEADLKQLVSKWKRTLFEYRNKRPKTRLDDKTLTSWSALMISGYVDAYKAFQDSTYKEAALQGAQFIQDQQTNNGEQLWHSFKNEKSYINGYLEDYASVIKSYIDLYEITFDTKWLDAAKKLTDYTLLNFYDPNKGMFYFTAKNEPTIINRTLEYRDNVIPASNSIMAHNLFLLSHHFDNAEYREISEQMLKNVFSEMKQYPSGFSNWFSLLEQHQSKFYEIVIVGAEASKKAEAFQKYYIPNALFVVSDIENNRLPLLKGRYIEDQTLIYVCVNNTCKLPVSEVEEALKLVENYKFLKI